MSAEEVESKEALKSIEQEEIEIVAIRNEKNGKDNDDDGFVYPY